MPATSNRQRLLSTLFTTLKKQYDPPAAPPRPVLDELIYALLRENALPKGDVLAVARIAAVQAAKQTSSLIPLCHNLPLVAVDVKIEILADRVRLEATVESIGKTGVEMEALIAVSVGALTIYDMCKAVDKAMRFGGVRALEKTKE